MDDQSKKAWGFVAVAAFAVLVIARKMLGGDVEKQDSEAAAAQREIVASGRAPSPSQSYLYQRSATHKHQGIDIEAPTGASIYTTGPGRVAARWRDGAVKGYGNTLVIQHPDGTQTLYAHMKGFAPGIKRGSRLTDGQLIGYVGQTQLPRPPMTSKPHLHFEAHLAHTLRINENSPERMDPIDYLAQRGIEVMA